MYKVNASLADQPLEIGRARVFTPGWLENESIWLHMEYKYLLELLRNELYEEFFAEFRTVCIPFLRPDVYGRSILENSSFIASSAHTDPKIHGNGFVARLTGATAEFIHMLLLMALGPRPFRLNESGQLQLSLEPALPGWLFTDKPNTVQLYSANGRHQVELPAGTFSFMFLGKILVTYYNGDHKDTFGETGVKPVKWRITDSTGSTTAIEGRTVDGEAAVRIRERRVSRIEIELG
jgi:hypothetical protein